MRVVAKGFDMHGEPVSIEGHELLARALQHETDHLDGKLFIDYLESMDELIPVGSDDDDDETDAGDDEHPTHTREAARALA